MRVSFISLPSTVVPVSIVPCCNEFRPLVEPNDGKLGCSSALHRRKIFLGRRIRDCQGTARTRTVKSFFVEAINEIYAEEEYEGNPLSPPPAKEEDRYEGNGFQYTDRYQGNLFKFGIRMVQIGWYAGTFVGALAFDFASNRVKANMPKRAENLRHTLFNLGPTFVKVGQALSTRPDLLPAPYMQSMAMLQDSLPAFPNEVAYRFIEEELGVPADRVFAEIGPAPVAAASLGQVYKGVLHTGETVAIKLQRPDVEDTIAMDMTVARRVAALTATLVNVIRPDLDLDLVAVVDEFAAQLFDELDYLQEARNAEEFFALYGHLPKVYVPRIYREVTRRRILTMEWVDGTKLTEVEAIKAQGLDIHDLIETLVQCSLRQLLDKGFFHADPHPGNLLAMPDGKLAFLDFGMVSRVEAYQRYGLLEAIVDLVNREFDKLAELYVTLGFLDPGADLSPIVEALAETMPDVIKQSVNKLNFKTVINELGGIFFRFQFHVPPFYTSIVRCLGVLEGLALSADPDFKILASAYPYVANRLLTDDELAYVVQGLVLKDNRIQWGRLEDLLVQASGTPDFNIGAAVNEFVEYLLSERGRVHRELLASEMVDLVDELVYEGQLTVNAAITRPRQLVRVAAMGLSEAIDSQQTLDLPRAFHHMSQAVAAEVLPPEDVVLTVNGNGAATSIGASRSTAIVPLNGKDAFAAPEALIRAQRRRNAQCILRIAAMARSTPGLDRDLASRLIFKLVSSPISAQFGVSVAMGLADRYTARLLRRVLLGDDP